MDTESFTDVTVFTVYFIFSLSKKLTHAFMSLLSVDADTRLALRNSSPSDLHMSDNEIGDESLEGLGHALRRNSSVRLLELCFNRITGAGAEAFSKSMWGCATLRSLRLDNNQVKTGAVLTRNESLDN